MRLKSVPVYLQIFSPQLALDSKHAESPFKGLGRAEGRGPGHVVLRAEDPAAPVPAAHGT